MRDRGSAGNDDNEIMRMSDNAKRETRVAVLRRVIRKYREDLLHGAAPSDAIVPAYRAWTHVERGQ